MTSIKKAKYKVSRRLGVSIWGDDKDPFHKKNYTPGQHKKLRAVKASDYAVHLKAKQRIKAHYGRIKEKQIKTLFAAAKRKQGNTEDNFISLLERRLEVVVYRLNFAPSIFAARQMVSHKHVKVNGRVLNIPSALIKDGDEIEVIERVKSKPYVAETVEAEKRKVPEYLELDSKAVKGKFLRSPSALDVPMPFELEMGYVVEFYSK